MVPARRGPSLRAGITMLMSGRAIALAQPLFAAMPEIEVIAVIAVVAVVETSETMPTMAAQQQHPHSPIIGTPGPPGPGPGPGPGPPG
jgi:hypothetical protein